MDYKQAKSRESTEEKSHSDHDQVELDFETPSAPCSRQINPELARFPYCMVWTPIPLVTWLLPFIGHLGIATSQGIIHDFAGSYFISVDDFAFGSPHKYSFAEPIHV